MNKEEFIKAIENVPKTDSINPISAYNSINVEDLANAVDRLKKVPTYDELLKENKKYKEVIDKLNNKINLLKTCEDKPKEDIIYPHWEICNETKQELLDILKGADND